MDGVNLMAGPDPQRVAVRAWGASPPTISGDVIAAGVARPTAVVLSLRLAGAIAAESTASSPASAGAPVTGTVSRPQFHIKPADARLRRPASTLRCRTVSSSCAIVRARRVAGTP